MTSPDTVARDVFDRTLIDAIDVVTHVYSEARLLLDHTGAALVERHQHASRQDDGRGFGFAVVYGDSLGRMHWSSLRSWVGIVAGRGLGVPDETARESEDESRPQGSAGGRILEVLPGDRLLFVKVILRPLMATDSPVVLGGLTDRFGLIDGDFPATVTVGVLAARLSPIVEVIGATSWTNSGVLETKTRVVAPKQGRLRIGMSIEPFSVPMYDLRGLDRVDSDVVEPLSRLWNAGATSR